MLGRGRTGVSLRCSARGTRLRPDAAGPCPPPGLFTFPLPDCTRSFPAFSPPISLLPLLLPGVDMLKYDNCFAPAADWVVDRYTAMQAALNATGRHILYSL